MKSLFALKALAGKMLATAGGTAVEKAVIIATTVAVAGTGTVGVAAVATHNSKAETVQAGSTVEAVEDEAVAVVDETAADTAVVVNEAAWRQHMKEHGIEKGDARYIEAYGDDDPLLAATDRTAEPAPSTGKTPNTVDRPSVADKRVDETDDGKKAAEEAAAKKKAEEAQAAQNAQTVEVNAEEDVETEEYITVVSTGTDSAEVYIPPVIEEDVETEEYITVVSTGTCSVEIHIPPVEEEEDPVVEESKPVYIDWHSCSCGWSTGDYSALKDHMADHLWKGEKHSYSTVQIQQ